MSQQIQLTPTLPSSEGLQRIAWQLVLLSVMVLIAIFAVSNTARLAKLETNLHNAAQREPQSPDPLLSFVEIVLPDAPMPLLSSGYMGIAPSMHLIRVTGTRPLSNIDLLEHPSRRRYGRFDLIVAVVYMVPIALMLICYFLYGQLLSSGALARLMAGKLSAFDLMVEKLALPLAGWFGICFLVLISAFYSNGLRLDSNGVFSRLLLWSSVVFFYSLGWLLLLGVLILKRKDFAGAVMRYMAAFLLLCCVVPDLSQSVAQAITAPRVRLPLSLARRAFALDAPDLRKAKIDEYLKAKQFPAMNWEQALAPQRLGAISALAAEVVLEPKVLDFEDSQRRYAQVADWLSWASPASLAQFSMDDLAGTGSNRYQSFQEQSLTFYAKWQAYMIPKIIKGESMDFDGLRAAPRFFFVEEESSKILLRNGLRLLFLMLVCGGLGWALLKEVKQVLPAKENAAR